MSIDREIAVSYLLDELASEDRQDFEARMAVDADLRAVVEELRPVVLKLDELPPEVWEPVDPPPLDLVRATATRPEVPLAQREEEFETQRRSRSRTGSVWLRVAGFLATGAALLLVGFLIGSGTKDGDDSPPSVNPGPAIVLDRYGEGPNSAKGEVRMVSSEGDQMKLDVAGLKPNSDNEFYELWLLGKGGELVSLGSFRVGDEGNRTVELPLPVDPANFEYFDVSIESDRDGPDHSGRSVLRGTTY